MAMIYPPTRSSGTCIVASYGGSGSTFLGNLLKKSLKDWTVFHTHASPEGDFLGVPVFNRLTGHAEGPFSRRWPVADGTKVILIYRNPAEAYLSRCSFKHFLHLWSEDPYLHDVLGDDVSQANFFRQWRLFVSERKDILGMDRFLSKWLHFAEKRTVDICFVQYEHLGGHWADLAEFLGQDIFDESIGHFVPVGRDVDEVTKEIFAPLNDKISTFPRFSAFYRQSPRQPEPETATVGSRETNYFTVSGLDAGAGDALDRLAICHDVVTSVSDLKFLLPAYKNYHSPRVDFFEIFGLTEAFGNALLRDHVGGAGIEEFRVLKFSDFIYYAVFDPSFISGNINLIADIYRKDPRIWTVGHYYKMKHGFFENIRFKAEAAIFETPKSGRNVTIHLRRGDITADALFKGLPEDKILPRWRLGVHSRSLLHLQRAIEEIDARTDVPDEIDLVIVSDGVARLRNRFSREPRIMRNIEEMEFELTQETPRPLHKKIRSVKRFIGTDIDNTVKTLAAMHESDFLVSSSSSLPFLMARTSRLKVIIVE